jgi:hypothetical protein
VLLDELERDADVYSALVDAAHDRWRDHKEVRRWIRILRIFNVRQLTPLMLSASRKLGIEEFNKVLKLCVVVSFRYSIIGRNNPNELERTYNQVAVDIHTGKLSKAAQIFEQLRPIYVEDGDFKREFTYTQINTARRKPLVRYVLFELERDASGTVLDVDDDSATIEHILPENPSNQWLPAFPVDVQDSFIFRLGNYTLLEPSPNRAVENGSFAEKRLVYAQSRYALTRSILADDWTTDSITSRQEHMATRAAHIWRSDFA